MQQIGILYITNLLTEILNERTILLHTDEDAYFVAEVPSLPGCISQGETSKEALKNIQEAIELHIEVLQERSMLVPECN